MFKVNCRTRRGVKNTVDFAQGDISIMNTEFERFCVHGGWNEKRSYSECKEWGVLQCAPWTLDCPSNRES